MTAIWNALFTKISNVNMCDLSFCQVNNGCYFVMDGLFILRRRFKCISCYVDEGLVSSGIGCDWLAALALSRLP